MGALDAQECDWQEMHDKLILQTIAKFPQTLVVGFELEEYVFGCNVSPRVGWKELEAKGRVKDHVVEFAEVKTMRATAAAAAGIDLSVPLS